MDAIQLDLLDLIAEAENVQRKERLQLCPVLEEYQAEYIKTMESNSNTLCNTWCNSIKNKNGCFGTNSYFFPAGSYKNCFLELHLALDFPFVYGAINFQSGSPCYYGSGSPVTGDGDLIEFNVNESAKDVEEYLLRTIKESFDKDPNLEGESKHLSALKNLTNDVVAKAMRKLTETEE